MLERIPASLLGWWEAFEREHGPLTIQQRLDWLITAQLQQLPPWLQHDESADQMGALLDRLASRKDDPD